jgi:hypothetical protein
MHDAARVGKTTGEVEALEKLKEFTNKEVER